MSRLADAVGGAGKERAATAQAASSLERATARLAEATVRAREAPLRVGYAEERTRRAGRRLQSARASGSPSRIRKARAQLQLAQAQEMGERHRQQQASRGLRLAQGEQVRAEQEQQRQNSFGRRLRRRLGHAGNYAYAGMEEQSGFRSMGRFAEAGGELGGMIPGVGKVINAFGKLTGIAVDASEKLRQWGKQLHDANMRFAEFSPAMTKVMVDQQRRDVDLSRQRGEGRAASAEKLANALHEWEKVRSVFEDKIDDIKTALFEPLLGVTTDIGKKVLSILGLKEKEAAKTDEAYADELFYAEGAKFIEKYGLPEKFKE